MSIGFFPQPKLKSRVQDVKDDRKITVVSEKDFRIEVWFRDQHMCRFCLRKVLKTIARVPERGEVHHVYGRRGDFRYDARFALLLCLECHEKVTGRVAEKWIIEPTPLTVFLQVAGIPHDLIDARGPLTFVRVA